MSMRTVKKTNWHKIIERCTHLGVPPSQVFEHILAAKVKTPLGKNPTKNSVTSAMRRYRDTNTTPAAVKRLVQANESELRSLFAWVLKMGRQVDK